MSTHVNVRHAACGSCQTPLAAVNSSDVIHPQHPNHQYRQKGWLVLFLFLAASSCALCDAKTLHGLGFHTQCGEASVLPMLQQILPQQLHMLLHRGYFSMRKGGLQGPGPRVNK